MAQVTDMSKWYNDTKTSQGSAPTAAQIKDAMSSYRDYVAGKTNPNSGYIYNTYGEVIGNTGRGSGGYTDFGKSASNAVVNPIFAKTKDNNYLQRFLTATNGSEPGFMNYSLIPQKAQNWIDNNPNSLWDVQSLGDLWKSKYGDVSSIPGMINKYSYEFDGITPNVANTALLMPSTTNYQTANDMALDNDIRLAGIDPSTLSAEEKAELNRMLGGD